MLSYRLKAYSNWLTDLLLLFSLFALFYFYGAGTYPLFTPDEGRYSEAAREMIVTGNYITPHINGIVFLDKPILFYWLETCAIKLFGLNEWSLRFFPLIAGVTTCLFVYATARLLYNRRTGLFAAIILATSSLFFSGAHYINLDLEVAFWITSSLLAFISAIHTQQRLRKLFFILMYICSALAFLTKGLIGVVFPFSIAISWLFLQKRWQIFREINLFWGATIWLAIVAPWFLLMQKVNPMFFHYYFIQQHVVRFISADVFNNRLPFWFYIPIIVIGFFPWSIFLLQTFKNALLNCLKCLKNESYDLFFLIWFAFILIFFSIPHSKIISYILPSLPPLAILTAQYLNENYEKTSRFSFNFTRLNFVVMSFALIALTWYLAHSFGNALWVYAAIITLISLFGITGILLCNKQNLRNIFFICTATSCLTLITFVSSATYINQNSTKSLASKLKLVLQPDDEVVSYFKYYQDLPLYLERQITVVYKWNDPKILRKDNWARELTYGKHWYPSKHLIDENKFWEEWNGANRIFVFLNENYLQQFTEHHSTYFEIARSNDIILLTNQPEISYERFLKTHNLLSVNVKIGKVASTMNKAIV